MNRTIKQILLYSLITFGVSLAAHQDSSVIGDIRIHGRRHLSTSQIVQSLAIKPGSPLPKDWPNQSIEKLLEAYQNDGYFDSRVDSIRFEKMENGRLRLEIWLTEGPVARTGNIRIRMDGNESPVLREILDMDPGSPFMESRLQSGMSRILSHLSNQGRPLASVTIQSVYPAPDGYGIEADLDVTAGPQVIIGNLNTSGNTLTRKYVILRETRLKPGQVFRTRDVEAATANLRRLGYFKDVQDPDLRFYADKADVSFTVQEGGTNTFDGVIGYNPPRTEDLDAKGYFTGRLEFEFQNLMGTGRKLEAFWEKKDERTQNIRFGYEEPWLFGKPLYPGIYFRQEIRDTTYVEREWQAAVRAAPWPSLSAAVQAGRKFILPDSLGSAISRVPRNSTWFVSFSADYNALDDPVNPRRGARTRSTVSFGRKRNLGPTYLIAEDSLVRSSNTRFLSADVEAVLPTFRRQAVYLGLHGREVETGEGAVPLADQIRFGGTLTVRGYEEDAFRASEAAWLNAEYRYLFGPRSRAFLFMDIGTYQRREKSGFRVEDTVFGYGLGIRLETRLGVVGVDYGLGEGGSLSRGKVHVGVRNTF